MNEFFKLGMLAAFEKLSRQALGKMFKGQKFSTKALASMEKLPSSVVKSSPKDQVAYAKRLRERAQRIKAVKQKKATEPTAITSPAGRALFAQASGKSKALANAPTKVTSPAAVAPTKISKPPTAPVGATKVVKRPPTGGTGAAGAIFG